MFNDVLSQEAEKSLFDLWLHIFTSKNDFDNNCYEEFLYNCHWHPAMGLHLDVSLAREILDIKNSSKKIGDIIPKVDSIIFKYYSNDLIEKLLLKWSHYLADFRYKILTEAITAYFRQEYALTLCTLCCLWGNLINQIVVADENKIIDAKRRYRMVSDKSSWYYKFFDDQIYYDCRSKEAIKEGVPGRNALAHGYFNGYPSQKAALNAIIFTDYLFDLWKENRK